MNRPAPFKAQVYSMEHSLVYVLLAMLAYCMFSARISATGITMPMVFLALGICVGFTEGAPTTDTVTVFNDAEDLHFLPP